MTSGKTQITLYKQAKAGLKSLYIQTTQVSLGLMVMLVLTGGNPPGWLVSASFFLGIGFVAWSESKRQHTKINKETKFDDKWHPLREIFTHLGLSRNLSGRNLSGADLNFANLSGANLNFANLIEAKLFRANLRRANLRRANLSGTDLNFANLSGADLNFANLSGADLSGADLSGANLSEAHLNYAKLSRANLSGTYLIDTDLIGAKVKGARFGNNLGISESMKNDLIKRGAIFEDDPGDRSPVFIPH